MRKKILYNDDWIFVKSCADEAMAATAEGLTVNLPHTWNAADGQDGGNDYYRGRCYYVKKFTRPTYAPEEEVWLEFQAVNASADIYVNGQHLCRHDGGYSAFRVNITAALEEQNTLTVAADNGKNRTVYPQNADFTFYGGIYRDVWMIVVPQVHFALDYYGGDGFRVSAGVEVQSSGECFYEKEQSFSDGLKITAQSSNHGLENDGQYSNHGIESEARPSGNGQKWKPPEIIQENLRETQNRRSVVTLEAWAKEGDAVRFVIEGVGNVQVPLRNGYAVGKIIIENVHLWDGLAAPYLYSARAELFVGSEIYDEVKTRFGCRSFGVDKDRGFFLNGRSYPLRGAARHQDRKGVGNAITPTMMWEDMEIIREMGANTVRLAHYQHHQYFYDLCDEAGLVVWAEIPYISENMPEADSNTASQLTELITQCFHHPSIVCWGLSNEITLSGSVTEALLDNHANLHQLARRLDPARFTVMANVFILETDSPMLAIPDVNSYNLYFGWYLGELPDNDQWFARFRQKHPDMPIGLSEYGADGNPRFQTAHPERGDYSEQYQSVYHEHILALIAKNPYLWATHLWNMFDFAADARDEGGEHGLNQKGLVTFDRKIKKDAFYAYKANWSKEPFVHICGRRYLNRAEEVTEVKVYTNQKQVALYCDGRLVGEKQGGYRQVFEAALTGEHVIRAVSGKLSDEIRIRKVAEPDAAYIYNRGRLTNWFAEGELQFPEGFYSIRDKVSEINHSPQGAAVLKHTIEQVLSSRNNIANEVVLSDDIQQLFNAMTVEQLIKAAGDSVTPEMVLQLNQVLNQIPREI